MTVNEASRLHLYEMARESWGVDAADTLMNSIPADPDSFATKDDIALVRADMSTLGAELRGEIATLGAGLRGEIATLGAELRSEIARSTATTIRTIVFAMIASNATLVGLVFAAARLG